MRLILCHTKYPEGVINPIGIEIVVPIMILLNLERETLMVKLKWIIFQRTPRAASQLGIADSFHEWRGASRFLKIATNCPDGGGYFLLPACNRRSSLVPSGVAAAAFSDLR